MKEIPLTMGKIAIVDYEDYEWLNQWKWHASKHGRRFYARCSSGLKKYMHQVIINPRPGFEPDHINRNGLDNRRCNLREVTRRQNALNKPLESTVTLPGIRKNGKKWGARIRIGDKRISLGSYDTKEKASNAYRCKLDEIGEPLDALGVTLDELAGK